MKKYCSNHEKYLLFYYILNFDDIKISDFERGSLDRVNGLAVRTGCKNLRLDTILPFRKQILKLLN